MKSLTDHATRGAVLLFANLLVRKSAGLVTQLVLAKLLLEKDFGEYSLAMTVFTAVGLFREHAFRDVLVQRHADYQQSVNPLCWLALTVGVISAVCMCLIAPFVTSIYNVANPASLVRLIFVLASCQIAQAAGVVSNAKLQIDLRFKSIASIEFFGVLVDSISKILLAYFGFGALSFVISFLLFHSFRSAAFVFLARPPIRLNPQFDEWPKLIPDCARLVSTLYLYGLIQMGDYMVLGVMSTEAIVGLYFFAYMLSTQTASSLGTSLFQVLFPTLSRLTEEPGRQYHAFLRACNAMSTIAVPICLAQAALGGQIIRLLFDERWYGSIVMLQILSIGMTAQTVGGLAFTLMHAQGRFHLRFVLGLISVAVFFPLVAFGAYLANGVGVAVGVCLFWSVMAVVNLVVVIAPHGRPLYHVWNIFWAPVVGSVVAIGPGYLVSQTVLSGMPVGRLHEFLVIAITATISIPSYVLVLRLISPTSSAFLIERIATLLPKLGLARVKGR